MLVGHAILGDGGKEARMSDERMEAALTRPPDEYEEKFMAPGEKVIYRDKMSMHPGFHIALLTLVIGAVVALALTGAPVAITALPLLVGLAAWASMMTLRTTVSEENVHVHYGIFGPTIPIEKIQSVEPVEYSWIKYGGWGVRYSIWDNSWAYNMIGDKGRAVELKYDKNGKTRKVLVASNEPVLLADSILQARKRLESDTGVSLEFSHEDSDESQTDVEVEATEEISA